VNASETTIAEIEKIATPPPEDYREYKSRTRSAQAEDLMCFLRPVRRQEVSPCGHKVDPVSGPRINCDGCWFTFFTHPHNQTLTAFALNAMATPEGEAEYTKQAGRKLIKRLKRFAELQQQIMAMAESFKDDLTESIGLDLTAALTEGLTGEAVVAGSEESSEQQAL
jgi:hypothetical protein